MNNIEATHLGQNSSYPQQYSPEVLVAVPRYLNRKQYHLEEESLPFVGIDVWNAYEFSFLLQNGCPVVGTLKIVYDAQSPSLVESKSLKLYLNSFNMSNFGANVETGTKQSTSIIEHDLSALLQTKVSVYFYNSEERTVENDFSDFTILESKLNLATIDCSSYSETPDLLQAENKNETFKFGTHLLRSNCKITNQPDWGSLYIYAKGNSVPTKESFLKYLVSLRNENHFHEEICELVFKRIADLFQPDELMITCLYTRRGGIDINPARANKKELLPKQLIHPTTITKAAFRQ